MWSSGDVVAVRELWKGRVWKARPWIVVQDDPDELVLWIPRGAPTKIPDGSGIPRDAWELTDGPFSRSALRIARSGQLHSTLLFQGETGLEWYVNLERPLRRTRIGFDYLDRELDLLARPDGTWEWLDEDEFEEAQTLGVIDAIEAAEIRAEAERVLAEWPFPTGWEDWRQKPDWALPALPVGWDDVPRPVLRTERLELRPVDPSDLTWFAAFRADPRANRPARRPDGSDEYRVAPSGREAGLRPGRGGPREEQRARRDLPPTVLKGHVRALTPDTARRDVSRGWPRTRPSRTG